jgi:hypothetical protein
VIGWLRILGWTFFGVGAAAFVATGGFRGVAERNLLAIAAGLLMPVGMLLSSAAAVIARWRTMRELRRRIGKRDEPE